MRDRKVDWLEEIAAKAKVTRAEAAEVLEGRMIRPTPVIGTPKRLLLQAVAFRGHKNGVSGSADIRFEWTGLAPGLYGIASDLNLRGKSSVIRIVQWMLRGRAPEGLRADVKSWLHGCSLDFTLDGTSYRVAAETLANVEGSLKRIDGGRETPIVQFFGDDEFEAAMSDFFLRELGLGAIPQWRNGAGEDAGSQVVHGWPSLSGAMFIGTNYSVLLGDIPPAGGMAIHLLRMYLGLPWVTTLAAANAAQNAFDHGRQARETRSRTAEAGRSSRRDELSAQLTEKRRLRDATSSDEEVRRLLTDLQRALADDEVQVSRLQTRHSGLETLVREAQAAYATDRAELQSYEEALAAGAVFRVLEPSCCPRCETEITKEKRRLEKQTHACSICGERLASDEEAVAQKSAIETRVAASKEAQDKAKRQLDECVMSLSEATQRTALAKAQIESTAKQLATFGARQTLDLQVAVLEARLAEASRPAEADSSERADNEGNVLKAAVVATRTRLEADQETLLKDVSDELIRYAKRFGMTNLSAASLKANATLSVTTGGKETSYSKCTDGEKLRLKVATVLAMIKVAELKGVGRHPGLLMIDSPGAQEVINDDLDQLITGLQEAVLEFPHLQVFVASTASRIILERIPPKNLRHAKDDAYLW